MSSKRRRQGGAPAGREEPAPKNRMHLPVRIASSSAAGSLTVSSGGVANWAALAFAPFDSRLYLPPYFIATDRLSQPGISRFSTEYSLKTSLVGRDRTKTHRFLSEISLLAGLAHLPLFLSALLQLRLPYPLLSPLHHRLRRTRRDRVGMDGTKTRTSGKTLSSRRTAPLKPKAGLNGPPAPGSRARVLGANLS
jgi:hypothetical protein